MSFAAVASSCGGVEDQGGWIERVQAGPSSASSAPRRSGGVDEVGLGQHDAVGDRDLLDAIRCCRRAWLRH